MTRRRRRGQGDEPLIARLLRLGVLDEVGEGPERLIAWSDDFRTVISGSDPERRAAFHSAMATDDAATVRAWLAAEAAGARTEGASGEGSWAGWPVARPTPEDVLASLILGPPDEIASRQLAVLGLFREVGILDAVEVDPALGAVRIQLSAPYRRLIEAGRQPEQEPGFDAAWKEGPPAVRAWLAAEARMTPDRFGRWNLTSSSREAVPRSRAGLGYRREPTGVTA
jgi:hypothetical protein